MNEYERAARRMVDRRVSSEQERRAPRPFQSPGFNTVAQVLDVDNLPPRDRVEKWLRIHLITPKPEVLDVLQVCDSGAEVWFALGFTSLPQFSIDGPNTFRAGKATLTLQEPLESYRLDMVLRSPAHNIPLVIEIDGSHWHGTGEARECDAHRDDVIRSHRMRVMRVGDKVAKQTARQMWWTLYNTPALWESNA